MPRCRNCGMEFEKRSGNQRFCSQDCKNDYWRKRRLKHKNKDKFLQWPYSPCYEYSYRGVPVLYGYDGSIHIWDDNLNKYLSEDEFYANNGGGEDAPNS